MLLLQLRREFSELGGTNAPNHWSIFLAQLDELLSEALFLGVGARVCMVKECTGGDTTSEPFCGGEADDEWAENVLDFLIIQNVTDSCQGLCSLLTDDCFI